MTLLLLLAACGARTGLDEGDREAGTTTVETCNGIDDDGDGSVDEDVAPIHCGAGACAREVPGCVDGRVPECTPGDPLPEICNDLDDDCDGVADDGLGFGPVGDPILVRENEGSTGSCTSCNWAFGPTLWARDDELLALWHLGFDGSHPQPSTFTRRLSADGTPIGDVETLFEEPITDGFGLAVTDGAHAMLSYCLRWGPDDVDASTMIGPDGSAEGHVFRFADDSYCAVGAGVAWTGERHLFASAGGWGSSSDDQPLHVEVTDASGARIDEASFAISGGMASPPRIAVGHGRVAVVSAHYPDVAATAVTFRLFDPGGEPVGDPVLLEEPDASSRWSEVYVGATAEGWLVTGANDVDFPGGGRLLARLSPDGEILEAPVVLESDVGYDYWTMGTRAGGGLVLSGNAYLDGAFHLFTMTLDAEGRGDALWSAAAPEEALATVASSGTRTYLLWATITGDTVPNSIWITGLGCRDVGAP